jgi:hypothetical protein
MIADGYLRCRALKFSSTGSIKAIHHKDGPSAPNMEVQETSNEFMIKFFPKGSLMSSSGTGQLKEDRHASFSPTARLPFRQGLHSL